MIGINNKNNKGFTLVELIVALVIFSIVMLVVSAAFVQLLRTQRRASNYQVVEEDVSFMLESIAKELRVGVLNPEIGNLSDGSAQCDPGVSFAHPVYESVFYFLNGTNLQREVYDANGTSVSNVNSKNVLVRDVQFCVLGGGVGDFEQPRVMIFLEVESVNSIEPITLHIQTTISMRYVTDDVQIPF